MTSEVALLNKSAVALAADSATIVSYWENGEKVTRYFKGANKIFNISKRHPVGLMTYASANLAGVPWEVLVKAYRDSLKEKSHDALSGYASDLFDFITNDHHLFPVSVQEKQFLALADQAGTRIVSEIVRSDEYQTASNDAAKLSFLGGKIKERAAEIPNQPRLANASTEDATRARAAFTEKTVELIKADTYFKARGADQFAAELANASIDAIYTRGRSPLDSTGLVLAGYGDKEYFPKLKVFRCWGLVLGKLIFEEERDIQIDQENASDYVALAQAEMIRTFIFGASISSLVKTSECFNDGIEEFESALRAMKGVVIPDDLSALRSAASDSFTDALADYYHNSHQWPLRRVISSLPIGELAELAETLIYMESLKERVTTPAQSVSGPIDVAAISKSDGFIWIKRKHYFDPNLNRRFLSRMDRP